MNPVDVIRAKRDGERLDPATIEWFIAEYTAGRHVSSEQAAAMAMAIFFQGLDGPELNAWTRAMIESGSRLDLGAIGRPSVDKHSTGGVGDKISLILVPLVAACGAAVPQLSGRGLGHTGGTLDKMEAIAGWQAQMSVDDLRHQLATIGGVIAGASADLAPADQKLYALRDVTATVESIPLIASSIMSKKIAEGATALVLDVKVGAGAFMTDIDQARLLARTMVDLGQSHGVQTRALLTAMDEVLGYTVGNALEVEESLAVLAGGGPTDIIDLTVALATEMLDLVGIDADPAAVLSSGQALPVFEAMVAGQGGDLDPPLPEAAHRATIDATRGGIVASVQARPVGVTAWQLGAGRAHQDDTVSAAAGVRCLVKKGDTVKAGQPLLELHADSATHIDRVRALAETAVIVDDSAPSITPLVIDRILPTQ